MGDSLVIFVPIAVLALFWTYSRISQGAKDRDELQRLRTKYNTKTSEIHHLEQENQSLSQCINEKDQIYHKLCQKPSIAMNEISSLVADHYTLQYIKSAEYLETKKHPARKEALRIRELKNQTNDLVYNHKMTQYKLEYLFSIFPDLQYYVEDSDIIDNLSEYRSVTQFEDEFDRTRNYVTREEWQQLSTQEKNQLALERYIKSEKTKWQIGRDYELFVGYQYEDAGWTVEYFGIEKQIEDMGRDLIARRDGETRIIQCKYWSQDKKIHEKHIAQLYGTTVQYMLSEKTDCQYNLCSQSVSVTPVLVTNITLS